MRIGTAEFEAKNSARQIEPRYTFCLSFNKSGTDLVYFTSHDDAPIPAGAVVYHGTVKGLSGASQSIDIETGASTIGSTSVQIIDIDANADGYGDISALIASKLAAGDSIYHRPAWLYYGLRGLSWADISGYPAWAQIVDGVSYDRGFITLKCVTRNLLAKKKICIPKKTNLFADLALAPSAIPVYDVTGFAMCRHSTNWSDGATAADYGYVKIDDEVFRYTTIDTQTTDYVTNGNFTASTGWTFNAGWAHDAGNGEADATAASTDVERAITVTTGNYYAVTFTIRNRTAGTVTPKLGGTVGTARGYDGTFTETILAGSGGLIELTGAGFTGSIDDVIVVAAEDKFSGTVTSARFTTVNVPHIRGTGTDTKRYNAVEEWIYLEMPAVKMILALLTGGIYTPSTAFASWPKLPSHWHAGVSITDIDLTAFENIGVDIWDPSDDSKGVLARADGLNSIDCKSWIEKELNIMAGVAQPINSTGQISLKRMQRMVSDATGVATIDASNTLDISGLTYAGDKVKNRFHVKWSYDAAVLKDYLRTNEVYDVNSETTYDASPIKTLEFKALHGSIATENNLNFLAQIYMDRFSGWPILLEVTVPHILMGVEPLDVVRLKNTKIPDLMNGSTLDRAFEVLHVKPDYRVGRATLSLFGSTSRATPVALFSDARVLDDAYYGTVGTLLTTHLTAQGIAYSTSGANITITGSGTIVGSTTYTTYYHLGNVTIDGALIFSGNVKIEARGVITHNSACTGTGGLAGAAASSTLAQGTPGYIGSSGPSGGMILRHEGVNGGGGVGSVDTYASIRSLSAAPYLTEGKNASIPRLSLKNNGTTLAGLPADGRGTSGPNGGSVTNAHTGAITNGTAGGMGGASVIYVSRGGAWGASGSINLSGVDAAVPSGITSTFKVFTVAAGAGGGGCAGAFYWLLDGANVAVPTITGRVISKNGASPVYPAAENHPILSSDITGRTGYVYQSASRYGPDVAALATESSALVQFIPRRITAVADIAVTAVVAPTGLTLASGTAELFKQPDGTIIPRIKCTWTGSIDRLLKGYRIEYKTNAASVWTSISSLLTKDLTTFWLSEHIQSGTSYDVRIKAVNRYDYESAYNTVTAHTVIGVTAAPDAVATFSVVRLADGTREYTWTYGTEAVDLAGFRIYYKLDSGGSAPALNTMTQLPGAELVPRKLRRHESSLLVSGTYWFSIVAVDTTGNESSQISTQKTLIDYRVDTHAFLASNWTERANAKNIRLNAITWSSSLNLFVAVGSGDGTDAYILTSPDGITWTERANPKNLSLNAIVWSSSLNLFVSVGSGDGTDAYILTSADGITWTERANPKNSSLYAIAWTGSLFVAVGNEHGTGAYIVTSTDGITWTERANPKNFNLWAIAWSSSLNLFVAVGNPDGTDAYLITSADGITWTERANPKNFRLYAIAWSGSLFVAVGLNDGTDAYLITSTDGITWTERANPKNYTLFGIAWSGSLFVACGGPDATDIYLITSPDGITWTDRITPKRSFLLGVTWSGSQFVCVGVNDGTDANIFTSLSFAQ